MLIDTDGGPCNDSGPCWDPPYLDWSYGSDTWVHNTLNGPVHRGYAFTESHSGNHATVRVDAVAVTYLFCQNDADARSEHGRLSRTESVPGRAEVTFRFAPDDDYGFQVLGTHTFTPAAGSGGGATFTSEASHCDDDPLDEPFDW